MEHDKGFIPRQCPRIFRSPDSISIILSFFGKSSQPPLVSRTEERPCQKRLSPNTGKQVAIGTKPDPHNIVD
jgi:hypothetical protein